MTLIVALQGKEELVFASDTMGYDGVKAGYYKFQASKLRILGQNWISGSSGTGIGWDLQAQIEAANETFEENIDVGAPNYALRTMALYRKNQYAGDTSFLLGGFNQHGPVIYRWSLPGFSGPIRCRAGRAAIGIGEHGAMHFAAAYHNESMTSEQRMLLAYFCIYEATKNDPRVGTPVELAVARREGVRICSQSELAYLCRQSEALGGYISAQFSAPASPLNP